MSEPRIPGEQESVFAAMGRQIAVTPLPDRRPATLRQRLARHPRVTVGAAGALAVAVAAVIFATGALTSAPPAFAVTVSGDSVTITLRQFSALSSLNARLAAEDIPVRAVRVVAGCTATARLVGANGPVSRTLHAGHVSGPGTLHISLTHRPPPGDTLVVGASGDHSLLFPQEIQGPVPRCIGVGPTLRRPKGH